MSPYGLSEVESAQAIGKKIRTSPASSSAWVASPESRPVRAREGARSRGRAAAARSATESSAPATRLALVVDPGAPGAEDEQGQEHDAEEEDPCQDGGVPHLEVLEGVPVEVEDVEEGRVVRTALGHDQGLGEDLE